MLPTPSDRTCVRSYRTEIVSEGSCSRHRRPALDVFPTSSYGVTVGIEVEDLSEQRLTEWLISADSSARVDAWTRLVDAFGRDEASRRWLAVFAASDAAET